MTTPKLPATASPAHTVRTFKIYLPNDQVSSHIWDGKKSIKFYLDKVLTGRPELTLETCAAQDASGNMVDINAILSSVSFAEIKFGPHEEIANIAISPTPAAPRSRPPSQSISSPPLPENWEEATSADGRKYFFNTKTLVTSWERPGGETDAPLQKSSSFPSIPSSSDWDTHVTPEGRKYYSNKLTKEVTWEKPASMRKHKREPSGSGLATSGRSPSKSVLTASRKGEPNAEVLARITAAEERMARIEQASAANQKLLEQILALVK